MRIARIAMDAGVSSALVHYHFATREALLAEALDYSYTRAGDARISSGELPARLARRAPARMIDQCLPTTPALREDWVLWVELWLRAVRHPELRPVAEELYARLRRLVRRRDRGRRRATASSSAATPRRWPTARSR